MIDNNENVSALFRKVKARNEAEIMSLVVGAKRWIESSENPDKLKEKVKELTEKEVNKDELGIMAISG